MIAQDAMNTGSDALRDAFHQNGYVVIDTHIEHHILDSVIEDLAPYFGSDREIPIHVPASTPKRIQDAWYIYQNVHDIAQAPAVLEALQALYGAPAKAFQTLNFNVGTEQPVHSDSIHFNSEPFGAMCGVWTALEDISMDQGPLVYYPGSHHLPEMNYDDFELEARYASYPLYLEALHSIIRERQFQPSYGIIKKGQAIVWAANLLHGGSEQTDKNLSRHSQVTHYYIGDAKPWRPVFSHKKRAYFEPDVVRDVSDEPRKYPLEMPPWPRRIYEGVKRRIVNKILKAE